VDIAHSKVNGSTSVGTRDTTLFWLLANGRTSRSDIDSFALFRTLRALIFFFIGQCEDGCTAQAVKAPALTLPYCSATSPS
jgi:hypothetical protein